MPAFPIIDAHVHLWDPEHTSYRWLADLPTLQRAFTLEDFDAACRAEDDAAPGVDVEGAIFLECDCIAEHAGREVQWVRELTSARSQGPGTRVLGIVAGHRVERSGEDRTVLEAYAADPLVKGVRRLLQDEKEADFCLSDDFVSGVRILAEYDLSFDLCIRHWQLASVVELVRRVPEVRFVLDHLGKPNIVGGELDPWRANLEALAGLPNVHCKLSGLANEAVLGSLSPEEARSSWTAKDLEPYIAHALQCFGPGRVMFGGDWPVLTLAGEYRSWVAILEQATAHLDETARRQLWRENALDFYQVTP